jgi:hypothetical protein
MVGFFVLSERMPVRCSAGNTNNNNKKGTMKNDRQLYDLQKLAEYNDESMGHIIARAEEKRYIALLKPYELIKYLEHRNDEEFINRI